MKEQPRFDPRTLSILLCSSLFLCASSLLAAPQGSGAAAGSSSEHSLSRKGHSLDLEGNFVPGTYTMALQAGTLAQSFDVVVDTGSANLILLGDSALCDNCADAVGQSYDPSKSSTAQLGETTFSVHYGEGSLEAREVSDKVALGSLSPIDYNFAVMTHQAGIHNTLGVTYKAVAQPQGKPLTPYLDELVQQTGMADEFSMLLCIEGQSKITFGASDVEVSNYTDIVEEKWYVVAPSKMQVKGGKRLGKFSARAVVDSGTTELLVPASMNAKILRALQPVAQKNNLDLSHALFETSAEVIAQFPVLQVVIENSEGQKINLDIAPQTYFGKVATVGYRLLISVMNTGQVILGEVFMQNYHVVFDRANKRIGFGSNAACG
ncbi:MAG: pepsin-like aspartic protease [Acidobacteriota bacterium]